MRRLMTIVFVLPLLLVCFANLSYAITVNETFDDLNQKTLGTPVLGAFGTFDFSITNNTGVTWTDFHFFDGEPIGVIDIDSYVGPGTASFDDLFHIDIVGLIVAQGEVLEFSIDENCFGEACGLGGAIWQGFPTTDGTPPPNGTVPEPASLLLIGSGLAGLAGWQLRGNRAASS